MRHWPPFVRSGGPSLPRRRGVRLLALLAVRDEMAYLPGWFDNVGPQVDGVVALDDGSTDGSGDYLASRPEVLELLHVSPDRPTWDEPGNYRRVVAAALRHEPDWLVSLDADERVERDFRTRTERVIRRGRLLGFGAYSLRIRSLWGSLEQIRVDGVWDTRIAPRLFRARPDHEFDDRPLHQVKAPLQARLPGGFPRADLEVYHLRTLRREDRLARRERYEALDPETRWQARGFDYAYLTDETGLQLRAVDPARHYDAGSAGAHVPIAAARAAP